MKTGPKKKNFASNVKAIIRRRLVAGLLVILPIYVTYFVIKFLIGLVGGVLSPVVKKVGVLLGGPTSGNTIEEIIVTTTAIMFVFLVLYSIGLFATNFIGRLLLGYFEAIVRTMPIVKNVYTSSKQLFHLISLPSREAFKRVVIVDYPRVGMKVIAFVTGSIKSKDGTELTSIFVPTTPNPTSGFLIYIPESDITETSMTIEEGMKLIFSGGILAPEDVEFGRKEIQET